MSDNDIARRCLMVSSNLAMGLLMGTGTTAMAQPATPRDIVVAFYRMAFEDHKVAEAFALYVSPIYKQHNPRVPDGPQATIDFLSRRFRENPTATNRMVRVIADGPMVALHVHSILGPTDRGNAIVDIFRVENGKIVEHWDVIQAVPETAANPNTMF